MYSHPEDHMRSSTEKSDTIPDKRRQTPLPPPQFDTLQAVRNLKNAEFGDKQAVTLVETFQDAQSELATRADLEGTELALRTDLEKMESGIRHDMERMESGILQDMERMESRLRGEMDARFNKLSWQILAGTGGTAGAITSILGLLILFQ